MLVVQRDVSRVSPIQVAILPLTLVVIDLRYVANIEPMTAKNGNCLLEGIILLLDHLHVDRLRLQRVVPADLLNNHS